MRYFCISSFFEILRSLLMPDHSEPVITVDCIYVIFNDPLSHV